MNSATKQIETFQDKRAPRFPSEVLTYGDHLGDNLSSIPPQQKQRSPESYNYKSNLGRVLPGRPIQE